MSGIFGELLKAGIDMATQNNPSNSQQRGQGGSLLESLGQVAQQNPSSGFNSGSLLDSIGGMLGGSQQQSQNSGVGGMLGGLVGSLAGGGRSSGLTGGLTGSIGQMLGGKKGALIAGALGMLLSSSGGRKMAGKLVKVGGLSAIGMMAYKAYANSKGSSPTVDTSQFNGNDFGATVDKIDDSDGMNRRSFAIMKAMIAAAKADGQVDPAEQQAIRAQMDNLGLDDSDLLALKDELTKPLDANDVAAAADSPSAAAEMYLVSRLVIDVDSQAEKNYIQNLARALSLSPQMVENLDLQISQLS